MNLFKSGLQKVGIVTPEQMEHTPSSAPPPSHGEARTPFCVGWRCDFQPHMYGANPTQTDMATAQRWLPLVAPPPAPPPIWPSPPPPAPSNKKTFDRLAPPPSLGATGCNSGEPVAARVPALPVPRTGRLRRNCGAANPGARTGLVESRSGARATDRRTERTRAKGRERERGRTSGYPG